MFSIVIPIFNEAGNIETLINEIHISLEKKYNKFELILVNDASNDNTIEIINNLKKKYNIILLNNNFNKGQSYSICNGINESKNNTIVTLDGDGQNNPADIISLLDKYFSDDDIYLVGGIRQKRKDNLVKIYSSLFANKVRSYIFDDGCKDTGCSLKVFDREIFLEFPFFDGIHRFLPALFKGYGYKTDFINVSHRTRIRGMSNYGTFDRLYRGIIDIIKVKKILKNNANK
jgi:dolichol-phosphate mannosyltransferase